MYRINIIMVVCYGSKAKNFIFRIYLLLAVLVSIRGSATAQTTVNFSSSGTYTFTVPG
jgi:hypothetical protein